MSETSQRQQVYIMDDLSNAFSAVRQADAIARLAQVTLLHHEEEPRDSETATDFADLGHPMAVVRHLLDTALDAIDGAETSLRSASK